MTRSCIVARCRFGGSRSLRSRGHADDRDEAASRAAAPAKAARGVGALIYVAAPRERRYALPNTRFMLHQPTGAVRGGAADVEIEATQIVAMRERLNRIFAAATGQDLTRLARETRRDRWMTAHEAQAYGLVHRVIEHVHEV